MQQVANCIKFPQTDTYGTVSFAHLSCRKCDFLFAYCCEEPRPAIDAAVMPRFDAAKDDQ